MAVAPFNWDDAVQWDGPGAIAGSEEILSADRLDRARYAEFLTNYLAAEGKQRNYVLNLNAEWGAGKTWFIKRWYMELKSHYPTVYIDAWQQDFSDDPLLTVISSIIEQLRDATGKTVAIPDGIKSKLLGLLKVGGKLVLKSAIKKAGLEDSDFSVEGEDADKLVDTLCSNHKERYESIQYLKQEIRQWVEAAVAANLDQLGGQGSLDYPAFILIDELDRCRPSYAVEMLETIKHIFDIKGVVFVLATDTEQLQHAVKVIYGDGFDAKNYMGRFFQRRFSLPIASKETFIQECLIRKGLESKLPCIWPQCNDDEMSLVDMFTLLCEAHDASLRRIEQLIDRVIAIINNYKGPELINVIFVTFLCLQHEINPGIYSSIVSKRIVSDGPTLRELAAGQFSQYRDNKLKVNLRLKGFLAESIISPDISGQVINHVFQDVYRYFSLFDIISMTYSYMASDYIVNSVDRELYNCARKILNGESVPEDDENKVLFNKRLSSFTRDMQVYKNLVELAVNIM